MGVGLFAESLYTPGVQWFGGLVAGFITVTGIVGNFS